jgi:hypothetical protein
VVKIKFLIALLLFFFLSGVNQLKAEQLSNNDKADIKTVVEQQLEASQKTILKSLFLCRSIDKKNFFIP